MNMISQINAFENWLEYNELGAGPQLLWYKLLRVANRSGWQSELSIANTKLISMTMTSEKTLINNRNQLIQCGLLRYKKRGRTKAGIYTLVDLTTGNIPVKDVTTGNIPVNMKVNSSVDSSVNSSVDPSAYIKENQTKNKTSFSSPPDTSLSVFTSVRASVEENFGRMLSPLEFEMITGWIEKDGYDPDLIIMALKEAVLNSALSLKYMDKILLTWERKGIKSTKAANEEIQKHSGRRSAESTVSTKPRPQVTLHNWMEDGGIS